MALDDMPASDDMGLGGEEPSEPMDEFETEIRSAFPDNDWTPDRVMAMKEAIRLCLKEGEAGGYDKPAGPPKKDGLDMALIFPKANSKKGG